MQLKRFGVLAVLMLVMLQGCDESTPVFHETDNPLRLSDWNLFELENNYLTVNQNSLRIRPANTLFTDYAHKLRTLWIPQGKQIAVVDGSFDYPLGTVLSKTFYYPVDGNGDFLKTVDSGELSSISLQQNRLLETRLLVRRESAWEAFPYVWNDNQTEAFLRVAGTSFSASLKDSSAATGFTYFVPNENQCSGCHTRIHPDGGLEPLGAVAHQLNHSSNDNQNLLVAMMAKGWLAAMPELDPVPAWQNESLDLDQRARAYLDMNCGHCHNPDGPADTSALVLDGLNRSPLEMGVCKPPVAAGGGAGDRLYGLVPGEPDQSILLYRMQSVEPDEMMPELGRALVHSEGVELVSRWIASMTGACN